MGICRWIFGGARRQRRGEARFRVVIEPIEELRLELCRTFDCLVRGLSAAGTEQSLDAYYSEIIFSLELIVHDPFPKANIEVCHLLTQLLRILRWKPGARHFATDLAKSALPNCRHRNADVIIAAMDLFEASVCVPNRAKKKGAGTAAMADLVGFREENRKRTSFVFFMWPNRSTMTTLILLAVPIFL